MRERATSEMNGVFDKVVAYIFVCCVPRVRGPCLVIGVGKSKRCLQAQGCP